MSFILKNFSARSSSRLRSRQHQPGWRSGSKCEPRFRDHDRADRRSSQLKGSSTSGMRRRSPARSRSRGLRRQSRKDDPKSVSLFGRAGQHQRSPRTQCLSREAARHRLRSDRGRCPVSDFFGTCRLFHSDGCVYDRREEPHSPFKSLSGCAHTQHAAHHLVGCGAARRRASGLSRLAWLHSSSV